MKLCSKFIISIEPNRPLVILEVFVLFETTKQYEHNGHSNKIRTLIIDVDLWQKIALIPLTEMNLLKLLSQGARLVSPSELYNVIDHDMCIQMAYIATKFNISTNDIETYTLGHIHKKTYISLKKIFMEDYPEKFI